MATDRNFNSSFDHRVDYPFWQGLEAGEVRMQRCDSCRRWLWPAEWRCGECGSWELHWEAVEGRGTIYAWERTHHAFVPAFANMIPYVNVLIELPHAGNCRVVGLLMPPSDAVRVGMPVTAAIQPRSARTHDLPALWWRLAEGGNR